MDMRGVWPALLRQMGSDEARPYWDAVGHKANCLVWGDEHMIFPCSCGPEPTDA